ncbi:hypothetical protein [Pelagicoccus sp. SDUM812002]|uniref:hypothetical protein n=1 Tax=Pelagicoccus sp. SDUM812002 TaxID=3041266 RepID=UPI0028120D19|nr:hypothetical protein [Pelagicoccus sp. SDUM812002]
MSLSLGGASGLEDSSQALAKADQRQFAGGTSERGRVFRHWYGQHPDRDEGATTCLAKMVEARIAIMATQRDTSSWRYLKSPLV